MVDLASLESEEQREVLVLALDEDLRGVAGVVGFLVEDEAEAFEVPRTIPIARTGEPRPLLGARDVPFAVLGLRVEDEVAARDLGREGELRHALGIRDRGGLEDQAVVRLALP